jgi:DNA-binding CsgD family transcriptional regulator
MFPQEPGFLCNRAVLEYQVGQFDEGHAYLERFLQVMGQNQSAFPSYIVAIGSLAVPIIARITGSSQYFDAAEEYAERALTYPAAPPMGTHRGHLGLALVAVERNDAQAARIQYTHLEPRRGTMPLLQASYTPLPAVDRVLGLLSHTTGNLDQAISHFEDSLAFCRKAGYRPELAWASHDYAELLLQRGATRDHPRATSLLAESLAISQDLGMQPLMARVTALQELAQSRPARAPAYPDGLSHREVEVLRLIAAGKTDREIAGALVISVRTVGNHVSSILNKTRAINRTEAASYATRQGLA